ncbi:unnamed protein product [Penicillium nalgiovense]|uniref:Uncharacterized protein n=1 Tax=Penicillium nalgiovense TaxID=60175 RepID=A0A9W4HJC7_PENNA|nr:unnamed protein product [Penicillium nalgiovense]CAG8035358.1 unnamed protein product [Penicillium nalgiovense]CAG8040674.1 unnamed protein product [Penicillium nalgiovense]CAG8147287.1 unnamed protein product [Penicillium nalgiovense]CAG8932913.1 unnamed protein product [Penicillium nalgiovense]
MDNTPFVGNNAYEGSFYLSYPNREPHWLLASSCLVLHSSLHSSLHALLSKHLTNFEPL